MIEGMLKEDRGHVGIYMDKNKNVFVFYNEYLMSKDQIDDLIKKENLTKIGEYRNAFVGDMQEKLNIAHSCNLMEYFAYNGSKVNGEVRYIRSQPIYIRESIFNYVKRKLSEYVTKKKLTSKWRFKKWMKSIYKEKEPTFFFDDVFNHNEL